VTGGQSNPGPATRYGLRPHRASVSIPVTASTDAQVGKIDIWRFGGDITAGWPYVGSIANASGTFTDAYDDTSLLNSPMLEFDNFQPFPDTDITRSGTCTVVGTSVLRVSGDPFNPSWAPGSEININGITYHLYGQ